MEKFAYFIYAFEVALYFEIHLQSKYNYKYWFRSINL